MTTIIGSRRDADGNSRGFYDTNTQEEILRLSPVTFRGDFIGEGTVIPVAGSPTIGYPWVKKVVQTAGVPAVAGLTGVAGGIVALSLDATGEKQDAALYFNDLLQFDTTKNLDFSARAALSVVPAVAGTEAVIGLQSAWIDGPDNAAYYIRFQVSGSGVVNVQIKDGVSTRSYATAVTLLPGAFHQFKVNMADVGNCLFLMDGIAVAPFTGLTWGATGANAILQPYASVYKAAGVGTATLQLDMLQVATDRV